LSLPQVVRQDFDLLKVGGRLCCSRHRNVKIKTAHPPSLLVPAQLESFLGELGRLVANMDAEILEDEDNVSAKLGENDREAGLELIDRTSALVGRLRKPQ
jgi:hypothetical protein